MESINRIHTTIFTFGLRPSVSFGRAKIFSIHGLILFALYSPRIINKQIFGRNSDTMISSKRWKQDKATAAGEFNCRGGKRADSFLTVEIKSQDSLEQPGGKKSNTEQDKGGEG